MDPYDGLARADTVDLNHLAVGDRDDLRVVHQVPTVVSVQLDAGGGEDAIADCLAARAGTPVSVERVEELPGGVDVRVRAAELQITAGVDLTKAQVRSKHVE